jgi:prepilin-type N-terminal cleavage/methylation domain-containing protein
MRFFRRPTGNKKQRGFSLIEMLIVMGLLSILLVALTDMFTSVLNVQTESESTAAVSQDGRFVLARLGYDINHASSITTPAALGGSGSTLAIVVGGNTYTYTVSGGNLQLTNHLGTNNLNGSETTISGFTVQRLGVASKDSIRLSFTVTSRAQPKQGAEVKTFTTTVGRR